MGGQSERRDFHPWREGAMEYIHHVLQILIMGISIVGAVVVLWGIVVDAAAFFIM